MNTSYKSPAERATEKAAADKAIADAKKLAEETLKAKMAEIEFPRHIYGATAAGLAVYSTVMMGALDPGFKFDTFWNAGVAANFLMSMAVSLPMAVMWPITYVLNKSPDDYLVNYIFLMVAFINGWYLISAFWGSIALMIVSEVLETP